MLTVEEVKEKMSERGFSETMRGMRGREVSSITFIFDDPDYPAYSCTVYLENGHFKFQYAVPCSINQLITPECSPIMSDEQFERISSKFRKQVRVLHKNFGGRT